MLQIPDLKIENCAPKKEIRFYLCGVYFDSDEQVFVATDGHQIAVVPAGDSVDLEDSVSGIIPIDFFIDMRRRKVQGFSIMLPNKKKPPIATDTQGRTAACIDGVFPPWKKIMDSAVERPIKFSISFNADLLLPVSKAIARKGIIKMSFSTENDAIVIESNEPGHRALLMPCKM